MLDIDVDQAASAGGRFENMFEDENEDEDEGTVSEYVPLAFPGLFRRDSLLVFTARCEH